MPHAIPRPFLQRRPPPFVQSALTIAVGAALLMLPALLNGFPFIFDDSADYLVFTPKLHRSPFYGLFLFAFDFNRFIWGPVIAQSLIIAHLIWLIQRLILGRIPSWFFILTMAALTLLSSLPYVSAFLMADFFTPVMVLTGYLLVFWWDSLTRLGRIYIFLLSAVSVAAHVSHVTLALVVYLFLLAMKFAEGKYRLNWKTVVIATGPIALAASGILLNNVVIHKTASIAPAGKVFLLANLIEYGPARQYLAEVCPAAGYRICAISSTLPETANKFLWGGSLDKLGGFAGMRDEAQSIVSGTLSSRPLEVASLTAKLFFSGLMAHEPGVELGPVGNEPWMTNVIAKKFALNLQGYVTSAQNANAIPHRLLRLIDSFAFPISVALLLSGLAWSIWTKRGKISAVAAVILVSYLANVALCAIVSGVWARYQTRLSWLFLMGACIFMAELITTRNKQRQNTLNSSVDVVAEASRP
jgi:hypothetical protein